MKEFEPRKIDNLETMLRSLKNEIVPDVTFKQNTRIGLLNRISSSQSVPASRRYSGVFAKPFQSVLASLLIFLLGGAGTVFAAQSSLPSDTLYPVKTASEHVLLTVSPTSYYKGQVALLIADRRVNELKRLNALGRNHQIPNAVAAYEQSVKHVQEADNLPTEVIDEHLATHQQVLNEVLQKVPEQAKHAIQHAINASHRPH